MIRKGVVVHDMNITKNSILFLLSIGGEGLQSEVLRLLIDISTTRIWRSLA